MRMSSLTLPLKRAFFLPDPMYRVSLIFLGFLAVGLVIASKARTTSDIAGDPLLLAYTVFVTSFELSRVLGAMFYKNNSYLEAIESPNDLLTGEFEPTVTIVIPCMNEEKSIAKTIEKSFAADYPKEKLEVIAINDGSTDHTGEVLSQMKEKYPGLIVIDWKKNRGKRHGMAEGFKRATGEIIVQLDSDSYIDPPSFRQLIEPFRNRTIGAVCAHADPENVEKNFLTKMQGAYYFLSFRVLKAAESTFFTVFCCSGCSSAYRKSIVLPIIDEWLQEKFLGLSVTWGDDRALTNRVVRLGYKTMYSDAAQAYTICPDNLKQLLKQQVRWKKGWMVNSLFASKFIWKERPFVAFTYFFPLIAITLLTPFMATKALIYNPLVNGIPPFSYVFGVFLVASVITIYYRYVSRENKYWPYVFAWSALNMVILSFVLFYAALSIQNRKWGTR